jgi:hypothetical protein
MRLALAAGINLALVAPCAADLPIAQIADDGWHMPSHRM